MVTVSLWERRGELLRQGKGDWQQSKTNKEVASLKMYGYAGGHELVESSAIMVQRHSLSTVNMKHETQPLHPTVGQLHCS